MLNSKLVKKAHKMAREIKVQYPNVDYRFQYGLCLSYLLNKGEVEMENLQYGKFYLVEDLITVVNPNGKSVRFYNENKKFQGEEDITPELLKDVEKEITAPDRFNFKIRVMVNTFPIKDKLKNLGAKFVDYPEKCWVLDYGVDVSMFLKNSSSKKEGVWAEAFLDN